MKEQDLSHTGSYGYRSYDPHSHNAGKAANRNGTDIHETRYIVSSSVKLDTLSGESLVIFGLDLVAIPLQVPLLG